MVGRGAVEAVLGRHFGETVRVVETRAVGGGCINEAQVLFLSNGGRVFHKSNSDRYPGMFAAEAAGLDLLGGGGGPRVPRPIAVVEEGGSRHILLEYVPPGRPGPRFEEALGQELAALHLNMRSGRAGLEADNYIGSGRQYNGRLDAWPEFFARRRLEPQLALAAEKGRIDGGLAKAGRRLVDKVDGLLPDISEKSLLHGDLWAGNVMADEAGDPVVFDPAVYYGHPEADLAMTELFGRRDSAFYSAYAEAAGLDSGYRDRRDLYNLYHLLNHLNLFGASYLGAVTATLRRYSG